jgi:hypothetical protein
MTENPNTQTLETLLRRWAEMEPNRCRLNDDGDLCVMLRDRWKNALTFMREPDPERIQGAVQKAIEAHGLYKYVMQWAPDHGYVACVRDGTLADFEYEANSMAAALLGAYLMVLESDGFPLEAQQ